MIPKIIHYCWFGKKPKPKLVKECITSWYEKLPDYEIIEWNESNFNINHNSFIKDAYESKKFAFVSDYVRLFVLFTHGGIYLDTDVQVIKNLDSILYCSSFLGYENSKMIGTGVIGAEKNNDFISLFLDYYKDLKFNCDNLLPNVVILTDILSKLGLTCDNSFQVIKGNLYIYPFEFFTAKSFSTGKVCLTEHTFTIHHYAGSWLPTYVLYETSLWSKLGCKDYKVLSKFRRLFKRMSNKSKNIANHSVLN